MEEAEWVADRAHLRKLLRAHPTWPYQEYADQIGRSYDWVKKWAKRLLAAPPDNEAVLWSRSSARKHLALPLHPAVIEQILDIRDHPEDASQADPWPPRDLVLSAPQSSTSRSGAASASLDAHHLGNPARAWAHCRAEAT